LDTIGAGFERADGNIGSLDFDLGLVTAQLYVGNQPPGHLELEAMILELYQANFRELSQPHEVRMIQLHLCPRARTHGHCVPGHQRSVDRRLNPVTGVAALNGDVTIGEAHPRNPESGIGVTVVRLQRDLNQSGQSDRQDQWMGEGFPESSHGIASYPFDANSTRGVSLPADCTARQTTARKLLMVY
jgi:hypothetical protein